MIASKGMDGCAASAKVSEETFVSVRLSRSWRYLVPALSLLIILHGEALAQSPKFPKRLITLIVPSAPGGFLEIAARIITKDVTERAGTPFVLDFRQGGGGIVGLAAFKQAAPDGHTLLEGNSGPNVINPAIFANLPYDPIRDFMPVTTLVYTPTVFVVPAKSSAKTFADLVALADVKADGLSFGSAGVGSSSQVVGEMLRVTSKKTMVHVPYKGTGPMVIDLLEGRLDFSSTSYSAIKAHIDEGKLRPLAVPGDARIVQMPNIPTTTEVGYPTVKLDYWSGLFAPAGTPADIVEAIGEEFNKTLSNPKIIGMLEERGLVVKGNNPAEFKSQLESELKAIKEVIGAAGLAQ
jgi:tripartite-type tricarboxylate transporter receptor subunit TctC